MLRRGLVPLGFAAAAAPALCCPGSHRAVQSVEARQPDSTPGFRPASGTAPPPPLPPPLAAASLRSISIGKGSSKYPTAAAAVAAAVQRQSINTATRPCEAASSGGGSSADAKEASCPEGSPPRAALEAQLAEVEQRLTALYAQSDSLQQQETELAEAEEQLLREERRLFQQEWLVDQLEAALETQRAHLQAQLGLDPSPERPRQAVGQWEGQPHAPPAAAGGGQHPHGLPFLPPVWEDIDAPGALEQAGRLRGDSSSSSGYESGDEGGPGVAVPPPGGAEPRHD